MTKDLHINNLIGYKDVELSISHTNEGWESKEFFEWLATMSSMLYIELHLMLQLTINTPLLVKVDINNPQFVDVMFGVSEELSVDNTKDIEKELIINLNIKKDNLLYAKRDLPVEADWEVYKEDLLKTIDEKNITTQDIKNIYITFVDSIYAKGYCQIEFYVESYD